MKYSEVTMKGQVDLEIHLLGREEENALFFFVNQTYKHMPIHEPVCCTACGDHAKTVIEAAVKKKEILVKGSISTKLFEDEHTHRYYHMPLVEVESVELADDESEAPELSANAYGYIFELKRHRDRYGETYYTFLLSENWDLYLDDNWFRCTAYGETGELLFRAYKADSRKKLRLTGIVLAARKPSRKGTAHMFVRNVEGVEE